MTVLENEGDKLSDEDVGLLERRLSIVLPPRYRKFLLATNGGLPSPSTIDIASLQGSPTDVQVFFGINRSIQSSNIEWIRKAFVGRIDGNLLPAGCDSGGNIFCVSLRPSDEDAVYYIDLGVTPPAVHFVAITIDAMLDALTA